MSADITIENVPDDVAERLRERAKRNNQLPKDNLEVAAEEKDTWRAPLATRKALAKAKRIGVRTYPSSEEILRKMRDSR